MPGRAGLQPRHPRPDATRIAGISGTLVLNSLLLMLLLVPMSRPDLLPLPKKVQEFVWILPEQTPPEPPPQVAKVVKPQPVPQARVQPEIAVPPVDPVVIENGTIAADPPDASATTFATATPAMKTASPLAGIRLEYGDAPPPRYPREALLAGVQGTVLLQVLVDVDGRPLEVSIHRSSGDRRLDDAARRQVLRKWTFRPAMKAGVRVQAVGIVPVDFSLGRG